MILSNVNLKDARLRAHPAYELVLFDRLSLAEQQTLRGLTDDPECYGVLRSREDPTLSVKSISRDMALLLFSLRTAGPLPRFAANSLGDECATVIGKMVLDGILEIEANGEMLSGASAHAVIVGSGQDEKARAAEEAGGLAALSRRAIDYAAALQLEDVRELSGRLYSYNRIAAPRRWRALLPDQVTAAEHLISDRAARALASQWERLPESRTWIAFRAKQSLSVPEGNDSVTYKLYVSPAYSRIREAVEATAKAVGRGGGRGGAIQWKVGNGIRELLRPDKMVVYFRQFDELQETALLLLKDLEGCPAHGVPFTAELGGGGLLSWGIDPPFDRGSVSWLERESWRGKICNRLASALIQAAKSNTGNGISPAHFAMDRLRLEGIDPENWTPNGALAWS